MVFFTKVDDYSNVQLCWYFCVYCYQQLKSASKFSTGSPSYLKIMYTFNVNLNSFNLNGTSSGKPIN